MAGDRDWERETMRALAAYHANRAELEALDERIAIQREPPLEEHASGVVRVVPPADPDRVELLDVATLIAPQPEANLLIPGLGIAPGPPCAFAAQAFTGKTIASMSIGLAIATGRDVWGVYRARQGRVLHLDYELGRRHNGRYLRRLMLGMGITTEELSPNWQAAVYPSLNLTSRDAEDRFTRLFEGFAFVILDALRPMTPGVDENSSEMRAFVDILGRASERTGAVPWLIHHAGKSPAKGDERPRKEAGRGSSAIVDGCQSWFTATGAKGEPMRVSHEKDRELGETVPDFGLRIEDVAQGSDPKAGLRVVHLDREQLRTGGVTETGLEPHLGRIRQHLMTHHTFQGSKGTLCAELKMNRSSFYDAFARLEATGEVVVEGAPTGAKRIVWKGGSR